LLSYGHLKFFTLGPDIGRDRSPDTGHDTSDIGQDVILYSVQCCYAVHWTDNKNDFSLID